MKNQILTSLVFFALTSFGFCANVFASTVTGRGSALTDAGNCREATEPVSNAYDRALQDAQAQCQGVLRQVGEPVVTEVDVYTHAWTCGVEIRTDVTIEYECN